MLALNVFHNILTSLNDLKHIKRTILKNNTKLMAVFFLNKTCYLGHLLLSTLLMLIPSLLSGEQV